MKRIWVKFNDTLSIISGLWLAFVMVIICIDVGARIFFNSPIVGIVPLVVVSIPALVFLPMAGTEIHDAHLRVELVSILVSRRWQLVLDLLTFLLGLIYISIMAWIFFIFAGDALEAGEYLPGMARIRTWPTKIVMFVGVALFAIQLVLNLIGTLTKLIKSEA